MRIYGLGFFCLVFGKAGAQRLAPLPDSAARISIKTVPFRIPAQQLPLFCRFEYRVQQQTGRAVFIRLGSKDYVDYLEQKASGRFRRVSEGF